MECVRAGANAHTEASVINTEVWPDVLTLSYIDEQGTKHSFRREKNMETVNLVPDDIDRCPLEWYGQGETAMTIKKSEESPIHLLNFLNNFVDLSALNMRDEELREQLRDNQSELTRLRLDIKQKEEVKKIKSNFDAQLNHLQKDKVKDLVNFNLSLAKEREIRKSVINELNELVKKYGAILSDKSFFEWFTSLDTKDIIIGSEYIEQVKGIVDQFAKIVATKHTELIEELKLKINDLKLSIDNWKAKDTEYQQKIDAKREELETKGIPFDLLAYFLWLFFAFQLSIDNLRSFIFNLSSSINSVCFVATILANWSTMPFTCSMYSDPIMISLVSKLVNHSKKLLSDKIAPYFFTSSLSSLITLLRISLSFAKERLKLTKSLTLSF